MTPPQNLRPSVVTAEGLSIRSGIRNPGSYPERSCYSSGLQERTVAYRDLREFVEKLEKEGELKRIRPEVDPVLEIAEVVRPGQP